MNRAVREKNPKTAIECGRAAIAEMNGSATIGRFATAASGENDHGGSSEKRTEEDPPMTQSSSRFGKRRSTAKRPIVARASAAGSR